MKKIAFAILMMLPMLASADQFITKHTVKRIYVGGLSTAGFFTKQGMTPCLYGIMYIALTTEAGRAQLSLITTAKAAKQDIVRIDYSIDANQVCRLNSLDIE